MQCRQEVMSHDIILKMFFTNTETAQIKVSHHLDKLSFGLNFPMSYFKYVAPNDLIKLLLGLAL